LQISNILATHTKYSSNGKQAEKAHSIEVMEVIKQFGLLSIENVD